MRLIAVTVVVVILDLATPRDRRCCTWSVISYMSAIGLGVVVFQVFLGQELHWSVPGLAFVVLVAGCGLQHAAGVAVAGRGRHRECSSVIRTVALHGERSRQRV